MRLIIQFSKKYQNPESIVGLLNREDLNELILKIINNKDIRGFKIVDYRGDTQFKIYFSNIREKKR